jgi:hypothetical protein
MTSPPIDDPFEREHLLARDAGVLVFAPRAFEVSPDDLIRWVGLDLAAGVPHEIGTLAERFPAGRGGGVIDYSVRFYELGVGALAVATEIGEQERIHRVLEVLGVRGDVRARVNVTRPRGLSEPLGNVRVWGGEAGQPERAVASIHRHLRLLGLEPQPHGKSAPEPRFEPPAADRVAVELPAADASVLHPLVELLQSMPVEGVKPRPPRRISVLEDRVKRVDGGQIAYRYELHRVGTGVLHVRRREVESGSERPGLVRTWNVIGLRGGARLRLREVAGRAVAEIGGSRDGVSAVARFLSERFGART